MQPDIPGIALADFCYNNALAKLWVYDTIGPRVEMDIAVYFRTLAEMSELEQIALRECRGRVLDIGAGAGSHALELQARRMDVTALDISPGAVEVMKARGVRKAVSTDIFAFANERFDTLLLLMNGIGLVGNLEGLRTFMHHAKSLLHPGGQVLFDSSDVAYLYEDVLMPEDQYYGEIRCRYGYKRQKTGLFSWLYVDYDTLRRIAAEEGWRPELLYEDGDDQYLARLRML